MTSNDGNESDMYEVVPDMEQYAQDNITQYTSLADFENGFTTGDATTRRPRSQPYPLSCMAPRM